jgi:hypothetical protein
MTQTPARNPSMKASGAGIIWWPVCLARTYHDWDLRNQTAFGVLPPSTAAKTSGQLVRHHRAGPERPRILSRPE